MIRQFKICVCLLLVFMSSCAATPQADMSDEMFERSSALTKLAAAMEAYIRFGNPPKSATEAELLANGTSHDPSLLTNIGNYKVRVVDRNRHAVVLVCTKEGDRALLEDVGCTGKLEEHHWKKTTRPCDFTAEVEAVCGPA